MPEYKISGYFENPEGRNIWDYLNSDAPYQIFNSARIMSKGPDEDGMGPIWTATERA